MKKRKSVGLNAESELGNRARQLFDRWEYEIEIISEGFGRRENDESLQPDERSTAYLRREIYRVVNAMTTPGLRGRLEDALLCKLQYVPRTPFSQNPYLWALRAANGEDGITLSKDQISRYAKELRYAGRHQIPFQLLCGFLHQVGGIRVIERKLVEEEVEKWMIKDLPWGSF